MGEQVRVGEGRSTRACRNGEFVVGKDQSFYFLEMNTRLQVEHPASSTGLDLVELMIMAAGESRRPRQADVKREGWAIECRINAEDPFRSLLFHSDGWRRQPAAVDGLRHEHLSACVRTPAWRAARSRGPRLDDRRWDFVHGKDRNDTIAKMREALNGFVIRGIFEQHSFLRGTLAHPKFVAGDFNTGFIAEHYAKDSSGDAARRRGPAGRDRCLRPLEGAGAPAGITGQMRGHEFEVGEEFVVVKLDAAGQHQYQPARDRVRAARRQSGGGDQRALRDRQQWHLGGLRMRGTVNGQSFTACRSAAPARTCRASASASTVQALVLTPRTAELHKLMPFKAPPDMSRFLLSPMPGLLVDVAVARPEGAGGRTPGRHRGDEDGERRRRADGVVGKVLASKASRWPWTSRSWSSSNSLRRNRDVISLRWFSVARPGKPDPRHR